MNENIINSNLCYAENALYMILDKQLKKLLKDNDVTVAQLARATKISSKTIYQWLNGQNPRNLTQIKSVADYFKISIDKLAFGTTSDFVDNKINLELINFGNFDVYLKRVESKGSSR